ncbi:MAG: hypothetical protein KatS3mg010_0084 [Acidimicrobiia bacterium]|nr:MAG: hypothetical protein KatS3mg010_0084 [Acidimicrobiia bacterium]
MRGGSYHVGTVSPEIARNARSSQRCAPASGCGSESRAKKPTARVSSGCGRSSPPIIRQWKTSEYMGSRANPRRSPSSTAMRETTSHSMPVSSNTSLIAISDGEYPTSAQPTG